MNLFAFIYKYDDDGRLLLADDGCWGSGWSPYLLVRLILRMQIK